MPGPLSMPMMRGGSGGLGPYAFSEPRENARAGFSGKTAADHRSGKWSNRLSNRIRRAEEDKSPSSRRKK